MRFLPLIALLISIPAVAQDTPAAKPAGEKPAEEKKICRRVDVTGSYLGSKRVCRTKAEWQRLDDRAYSTLDRHKTANHGNFGLPKH